MLKKSIYWSKKSIIIPPTEEEILKKMMEKMRRDGRNNELVIESNMVGWTGSIGMEKIHEKADWKNTNWDIFNGKIKKELIEGKLNNARLSKLQREHKSKVKRIKYRNC